MQPYCSCLPKVPRHKSPDTYWMVTSTPLFEICIRLIHTATCRSGDGKQSSDMSGVHRVEKSIMLLLPDSLIRSDGTETLTEML